MQYNVWIMFFHLIWISFIYTGCHCLSVEIYPDIEELVLPTGAKLSLMCQSHENVTWILMNTDYQSHHDLSKPLHVYYKNGDMFASNLTIDHLTYHHVGSFKCVSSTQENSIYIYVKDNEHLLVHPDEPIITALENSDVIIPCKPTDPSVSVVLKTESGKEFPESRISFDPKLGFTLKRVVLEDTWTLTCEANGGEDERDIELKVEQKVIDIKPTLFTRNAQHVIVGQTLNLECSIDIPILASVDIFWDWPTKKTRPNDPRVLITNTDGSANNGLARKHTNLIIEGTTHDDEGDYVCSTKDYEHHVSSTVKNIKIHNENDTYLNLTVVKNSLIVPDRTPIVKWVVYWSGHPKPQFTWCTPKGKELPLGKSEMDKYEVEETEEETKLTIYDLHANDTGHYKLKAENKFHEKTLDLTLNVEGQPMVVLKADTELYTPGHTYQIDCTATAYPLPLVRWSFQRCDTFPRCDGDFKVIDANLYRETTFGNDSQIISSLSFFANYSGNLRCEACNNESQHKKHICGYDKVDIIISDVPNGFSFKGPPEVVEGDDVSLLCQANRYIYDPEFTLYNGTNRLHKIDKNTSGITLIQSSTPHSHQVELRFSKITMKQMGTFICEVKKKMLNDEREPESKEGEYDLFVKDLEAPRFSIEYNLKGPEMQVQTGDKVEFKCLTRGSPRPFISWYKNEKPFTPPNDKNQRIKFREHNQILEIVHSALGDEGTYECVASNRVNTIRAMKSLKLSDKPKTQLQTSIIILIGVLIVLFIICAIVICKIRSTARSYKRQLKNLGLANFEEGHIDSLNPDIRVDEQADLLPYDKKWEFPRNKLKLGKQLGSGAFGVVMQAEADGIIEQGVSTTVAVKMVKKTDVDLRYLKALSTELKIMGHLGKHLNIVNLLGACTGNLVKRELFVIVEFCRFGNLHNYLLKHRELYINQVDASGNVDPTITTIKSRYVNVPNPFVRSNSVSTTSKTYMTSKTMSTMVGSYSPQPDQMIGSDGYLIPVSKDQDSRSNYYKSANTEPISTQDLLCWAFQVASGMEYLASRKVMHGDLAARNILLAEDKIVKICDFGLAKNMYNYSQNYLRTGDEPLPIKWMAIESIRDRIFSTQSDVWAYGVTLWEMFTLAKTPYPGIEGVENLYLKLQEGYRMEKPEYATDDIYDVMLDCWRSKPVMRPNFTELVEKVGDMIEDDVRKHYLNLNEVYLRINDENFQDGQDYLAMLGSPDIQHITSQYGGPEEDQSDTPCEVVDNFGYLSIRRDSASPTDDNSMEMKPMLPHITADFTGSKSSSFSNPSYLELPSSAINNNNNNSNSNDSPEHAYVNTRNGGLHSVDDYHNTRQDINRNMKLNWLFPLDSRTSSTLV